MKELLSPTLIEQVSEHVLLWFKNSNKYIVIDTGIYALVKAFLNAENTDAFKSHLSEFGFETNLADNYLQDIDQLLEDCHVKPHMQTLAITPFNSSNRKLSLTYKIDLDAIRIHYST
ncbi:MAG: hypothetical protein KJN59_12095, partial [Bacteroidia bacterium]|nr:hypothetical protein [Bacteroidia bacterium]